MNDNHTQTYTHHKIQSLFRRYLVGLFTQYTAVVLARFRSTRAAFQTHLVGTRCCCIAFAAKTRALRWRFAFSRGSLGRFCTRRCFVRTGSRRSSFAIITGNTISGILSPKTPVCVGFYVTAHCPQKILRLGCPLQGARGWGSSFF